METSPNSEQDTAIPGNLVGRRGGSMKVHPAIRRLKKFILKDLPVKVRKKV